MTFRKWISKIHLYGGLLCFWFLIIFGLSALHFHHHFNFMDPENSKEIIRETMVKIEPEKDNSILARNLQNNLGIPGWFIPLQTSRDSLGIFHTTIQNPKARYMLDFDPSTSMVKIKTSSNGFWRIINSLHGNSGKKMPKAPLLVFWKIFLYLCSAIALFSVISGLWLWAGKPGNKRTGWLTVSGILVLSFLLMFIVYIYG